MDETSAGVVAEALGGTTWQSGGGIWLVLFECNDDRIVVLSDEAVVEYENHEEFDRRHSRSSILLR